MRCNDSASTTSGWLRVNVNLRKRSQRRKRALRFENAGQSGVRSEQTARLLGGDGFFDWIDGVDWIECVDSVDWIDSVDRIDCGTLLTPLTVEVVDEVDSFGRFDHPRQ